MHPGLAGMLWMAVTQAAVLGPKTTMGDLAPRAVDRELVMPRGWVAVSLGFDTKVSRATRDAWGVAQDWEGDTRWRYSRAWLEVHQGFSAHVTPYLRIPFVNANLRTSSGDTVSTTALGDVHAGLWFQPWLGGRHTVAAQLDLKSPTGVEWPGSAMDGGANTDSFLTGTGTTNVGLHLHGHARIGNITRAEGRVGVVARLPAVVGYVQEVDGFGNGWLDPGDELVGALVIRVQAKDEVHLKVEAVASARGTTWVGTSGASVWRVSWDPMMDPGLFVDGSLGFGWDLSKRWSVEGSLGRNFLGGDTRTFAALGLEEFSPQPGVTGALALEGRW